jgi:CRISPR system Cascade subunit CasC
MLAEQPVLNMDAACHVAHAISTNRTAMEFDYFTAVDDLQPEQDTGAGMIGTTMFNSSCFYRYAVIDMRQLLGNLPDEAGGRDLASAAVRGFIRGSIEAIPSGKQASTAVYTPPSFVMTVVRPEGGMPMSLANAFEAPVQPGRERGLVAESVRALDSHWGDLTAMYGVRGATPFVVAQESVATLESLAGNRCSTIDELLEKTMAALDDTVRRNGGPV